MPNRWVVFLIFIVVGFLMLMYTKKTKDFTGSWNWAEKYIGVGGTYTAIKLFGVLSIVFAFMYVTGHIEQLLLYYLGGIFGVKS